MPMSAEEKALRKEAKAKIAEAEKAARELEAAAELAAYKAGLPGRLAAAMEKAKNLGVGVDVGLNATGPLVTFYASESNFYVDSKLSYTSQEWEIESLEGDLCRLQAQVDLRAARRLIAQNSWNALTEEQRSCIREHINYLK